MANTRKHANATMRNVYFDGDLLKAIKEKDPNFNLSAEVNAMLKEKAELQKNEQAIMIDPLRLSNLTQSTPRTACSNNTRQSTLFETFASRDRRDEIVKYIQSVKDTSTLNQIEQNAKCMLKVSETHRQRLVISK